MKKVYERPMVEVAEFKSEDIITASTNEIKGFGTGFTFSTENGSNSIEY